MYIGIDVGGTKCAVVRGVGRTIEEKRRFATEGVHATLDRIFRETEALIAGGKVDGIGISCGGPLDEVRGRILSPPNLPGWDDIAIVDMLKERFGVPTYLLNDANACALAEWKYGAGAGTQSMIFMTFGTGLGAGVILDGRLYRGASGNAGEIGHVRLSKNGPVGYGKAGSAEGFCSGGGIGRLGRIYAERHLKKGGTLPYCESVAQLDAIDARVLAEYAAKGEPLAKRVYRESGKRLGQTCAILMDLFDPEAIVIGSVFVRAEALLRPPMERVLAREALAVVRRQCRILPAALGESIGDVAALTVAEGV